MKNKKNKTIGADKKKHNKLGFKITMIIFLALFFILFIPSLFGLITVNSLLYSNIFTVVAMALLITGKEVYDYLKPYPTGFDYKDIKYGVAGSLFGLIISNLIAIGSIYIIGVLW